MNLPILSKLKDGEKFDFATLVDNIDQTYEFWDWWWDTKYEPGKISRPEIISPEDPILTETRYKPTVDLCSYSHLFDSQLFNLIEAGLIPGQTSITRDSFRKTIKGIASNPAIKLPGKPQLVFTGGGYGSGKTTAVNYLAKNEKLPLEKKNMVGADIFKQLDPGIQLN